MCKQATSLPFRSTSSRTSSCPTVWSLLSPPARASLRSGCAVYSFVSSTAYRLPTPLSVHTHSSNCQLCGIFSVYTFMTVGTIHSAVISESGLPGAYSLRWSSYISMVVKRKQPASFAVTCRHLFHTYRRHSQSIARNRYHSWNSSVDGGP